VQPIPENTAANEATSNIKALPINLLPPGESAQ
jgi:hypothetical protein